MDRKTMTEFKYEEMFQTGKDTTEYRLLTTDHVSTFEIDGKQILKVDGKGLTLLARQAFQDVSHLLRKSHLEGLRQILQDPEASENDVYVATTLLENAVIAAEMVFPSCQDTGTAVVMAKKGKQV
jgi:fumarate hydratase, class I